MSDGPSWSDTIGTASMRLVASPPTAGASDTLTIERDVVQSLIRIASVASEANRGTLGAPSLAANATQEGWAVTLEQKEFGSVSFEADTLLEAIAGAKRLFDDKLNEFTR